MKTNPPSDAVADPAFGELRPAGRGGDGERSQVESVWGVLGTSFTLGTAATTLLLIVAAVFLWRTQTPADAEARIEELFRGDGAPFGLALLEASKLPTQETILRLGVEAGEERDEAAPDELVLIWYRDADSAKASFDGTNPMEAFQGPPDPGEKRREASRNMQRWRENPDFAWHTTMDAGEVEWSRWRVRYRIERSFRVGGTFRDSTRLLLTRPKDYLVLFAQTPVGVEATKETALLVARQLDLSSE